MQVNSLQRVRDSRCGSTRLQHLAAARSGPVGRALRGNASDPSKDSNYLI
jgi:hypothetical protein